MKTLFFPPMMQPILFVCKIHIKIVALAIAFGDVFTLGAIFIYGKLTETVYHEAEYHHLLVQWAVVALFLIGTQKNIVALLLPFIIYFFFYLLLTISGVAYIYYTLVTSPSYANCFDQELQKYLPWLSFQEAYVLVSGLVACGLSVRILSFDILIRCFVYICALKNKASDDKSPLINKV